MSYTPNVGVKGNNEAVVPENLCDAIRRFPTRQRSRPDWFSKDNAVNTRDARSARRVAHAVVVREIVEARAKTLERK